MWFGGCSRAEEHPGGHAALSGWPSGERTLLRSAEPVLLVPALWAWAASQGLGLSFRLYEMETATLPPEVCRLSRTMCVKGSPCF